MAVVKKNILILTSEFPPLPGGIGNHAYNISEFLADAGYNVTVIADQRDTEQNECIFDKKLKAKVHRVPRFKLRFIMYLQRIWLYFQYTRKSDVLLCSGKFPIWLGAFISKFISIEIIAVIHGTEVNFSKLLLKTAIDKSLQTFDKVIAVSAYTKQLVSHLNLKHIKVIPNGYNPSDWETIEANSITLNGSPKLLTVGNVTERKGQINVIKHLSELIKIYPDLHYHCVGFKTEVEACIELVKQLNIETHITFHGHVSHSELKTFYTNADICVMLSQKTNTGDVEGFGISLIEANHFGVPTIGATGCGIEDAINHDVSGLLIEANDTTAFCNAVETIFGASEQFKDGALRWAQKHNWQTIIQRYIEVIEA